MLVVSMRTSVPSWKHCDAARYPYLYKIPFYFHLKWRRNYKDVANFLINRILASRISHAELTHLVSEFCTAHNLYNVECRPTNIISQHLQLKFIGKGVSNQTLPLIHFSHIEVKYNPLSHELDAVLLNLFVHPIKVPLKMVDLDVPIVNTYICQFVHSICLDSLVLLLQLLFDLIYTFRYVLGLQ